MTKIELVSELVGGAYELIKLSIPYAAVIISGVIARQN
jgi:hypothetical protein